MRQEDKKAFFGFKKARIKKMYQNRHYPRYVENSKRPFVVYYPYCELTKKFVRKKIETKDKEKAKEIIKDILESMLAGHILDSANSEQEVKQKKEQQRKDVKVNEAFNHFIETKTLELQKKRSISSYTSDVNLFLSWCKEHHLENIYLREFTTENVKHYLKFVLEKTSIRTRNNKRAGLNMVWNWLIDEKYINTNPVKDTKKIKNGRIKRIVFENSHLKEMWNNWKATGNELYFVSKFIFYGFIRPNELRQLKVMDIDFRTNRITINKEVGKTGLGYINLTPPLLDLLNEMDIKNKKQDDLIFCNHIDSTKPVSHNRWTTLFLNHRLKNGYPKGYELYCFKHTGVKEHFLVGNTLDWIKKQCRHSEIATTLNYLTVGLGLEINENYIYKEPVI